MIECPFAEVSPLYPEKTDRQSNNSRHFLEAAFWPPRKVIIRPAA